MHNVVPEHALQRRSRNLIQVAILVLLSGIFMAVVGVALFIVALVVESNPDFNLYHVVRVLLVVGGSVIAIAGLLMIVRALTWKTDNNLALQVGDAIGQHLDERYTFIRNISKWQIGYIDGLLVGPPGVLVFRITDKTGVFFNEGHSWLKQKDKGQWNTMRWNPTKEVVADIHKLRRYFANRNLNDIPVFGVIVFTNDVPETQFSTQNPLVDVVYLSEFSYKLDTTYFAQDRIDPRTIQQIIDLLYTQ